MPTPTNSYALEMNAGMYGLNQTIVAYLSQLADTL